MSADVSPTEYLELKEFLARNPCVKPRTFSRWKKRGLIDFIQPGGANTQILVPKDALRRMEIRRQRHEQSDKENDSQPQPSVYTKGVRQPNWKRNPQRKPKTKDNNVKKE